MVKLINLEEIGTKKQGEHQNTHLLSREYMHSSFPCPTKGLLMTVNNKIPKKQNM